MLKKILLMLLMLNLGILAHEPAPYRMTVWVPGTNFQTLLPFSGSKFNQTRLEHFSTFRTGSESQQRAICLEQQDPVQFPLEGFYLFRWSGRLRHSARMSARSALFQALLDEIKRIQLSTGRPVYLTILTHSHGGSVGLGLAELNAHAGYPLRVDRLVLLACPVQARLAKFVGDPSFKQVYAFYSKSDLLQVLAPQAWWLIGARRKFQANSNLVHIQTCWQSGSGLGHNDFKSLKFLQSVPAILSNLESNWTAEISLKI